MDDIDGPFLIGRDVSELITEPPEPARYEVLIAITVEVSDPQQDPTKVSLLIAERALGDLNDTDRGQGLIYLTITVIIRPITQLLITTSALNGEPLIDEPITVIVEVIAQLSRGLAEG